MTTIGLAYLCGTIVAFLIFAGSIAWADVASARARSYRRAPDRLR
jgi:hypothetical protein